MQLIMKVHPDDNIIVALRDIQPGESLSLNGQSITMNEFIPIKHKFAESDFRKGDKVIMYGVCVGEATTHIPQGHKISTENIVHAVEGYTTQVSKTEWLGPDVSKFVNTKFSGYHRKNGEVGTRNYWLVFPMVFCENRNIEVIKKSMLARLGYATQEENTIDIEHLISLYENGASKEEILGAELKTRSQDPGANRLFKNIDGIKFLTHAGGCGGIRQDSETLCRLLAGYVANPNVAGATVLSLGCQHAQFEMLEQAMKEIHVDEGKQVIFLEQQDSTSERDFIADAVKQTFAGLVEANEVSRKPAPLSKLTIGLECGGSDGFSGITANPALGHASDILVKLGGKTILSEFPELNGVEQELINRCSSGVIAEKFSKIMSAYGKIADDQGSGFEMNPSPGNIKDGLITDAIKSAGAAKKGGTSPIVDVLDYTEQVTKSGLNLLCTPGNDVESTTGLAGSGANIIVFTTGLGTPTGNAITPTIKFSTNNSLFEKMNDIIDINAGTIVTGEDTIESKGEELLKFIVEIASGQHLTKAEILGQDDFIPWKRGISL